MGNKPQFKAEEFIRAIPGTAGIITTIAKRVGCTWHVAKKYIEAHPSIKQVYDAECEGILDLAEAKLIEQINQGEGWAIKYLLATKGKSRGYVERQETSSLNINVSELTEEQLVRIANGEEPLHVIATKGNS